MDYVLPSTAYKVSATQMIDLSMLVSPDRMCHYRCFAYPLTRTPARLEEVCDWLHLHTAGLSPATFRQLAWRTVFQFHHLILEFSALENVAMPALIARQGRAKAQERAETLLGPSINCVGKLSDSG